MRQRFREKRSGQDSQRDGRTEMERRGLASLFTLRMAPKRGTVLCGGD